ncbi:MAG TPA: NAD(P)H-dependent oxidoreductase [Gammaproteobacteria bacterium]
MPQEPHRGPALQVNYRDLGRDPVPHLDATRLTAIATAERTPEQQAIAAEADALIAELQQADLLVLGVPMYNFSVPTQLKAWFDHVARAGTTFRYTADGAQGLLVGKRAVVFTSRGGMHRGQASDTVTPWLRTVLGFLGIDEVEFVYAEGLNLGDDARQAGLDAAGRELDRLAAALPRAA